MDDGSEPIVARGACGDVAALAIRKGSDSAWVPSTADTPFIQQSAAIHVYGGDFFRAERSEWDPETLLEESYNVEKNMRLFKEANARLG